MTFNQDVKALRPTTDVTEDFLPYLLLGKKRRLLARVDLAGHGTGRLNSYELQTLEIRLPPKAEQRAISHILGTLDDKIELNRRRNETLGSMAHAVFLDWFIEFGPVRAKMEGRQPYLAPALWQLFPDRFDNEEKPEGWSRANLADFMSFRGGSQPAASNFVGEPRNGYVRLLQIRDYYTDKHMTYVPRSKKLRMVDVDDLCIGRYGAGSGAEGDSLGRLCRGKVGAINVALVVVNPLFECREWLATFIGSGRFRTAISGGSARAVQAGFRQEDLKHVEVIRAHHDVHRAFERFGSLIWSKRKQLSTESEILIRLRDTLLPKLTSGALRIADAKRFMEMRL
jgi:type I restriction enzyme S subunit